MDKKTDDGGPAFPVPNDANVNGQAGMTLRDWFAGQALSGLCVDEYSSVKTGARRAYELADAMLAERERTTKGDGR